MENEYTVQLSIGHIMNILSQIAKKNKKWKPEGEHKKLIDPDAMYMDAISNNLIILIDDNPGIAYVQPGFIDKLWNGYCMDKYTAYLNKKAEKHKNLKSKFKKQSS